MNRRIGFIDYNGNDNLPHSNKEIDNTQSSSQEVDMVNSPPHYTSHPSGIEVINIARWMNFNRGNILKYVCRAGIKDKSKEIEDLKKAMYYLNDEIKRLEYEQSRQEQ